MNNLSSLPKHLSQSSQNFTSNANFPQTLDHNFKKVGNSYVTTDPLVVAMAAGHGVYYNLIGNGLLLMLNVAYRMAAGGFFLFDQTVPKGIEGEMLLIIFIAVSVIVLNLYFIFSLASFAAQETKNIIRSCYGRKQEVAYRQHAIIASIVYFVIIGCDVAIMVLSGIYVGVAASLTFTGLTVIIWFFSGFLQRYTQSYQVLKIYDVLRTRDGDDTSKTLLNDKRTRLEKMLLEQQYNEQAAKYKEEIAKRLKEQGIDIDNIDIDIEMGLNINEEESLKDSDNSSESEESEASSESSDSEASSEDNVSSLEDA
jgi:hypothetical protein